MLIVVFNEKILLGVSLYLSKPGLFSRQPVDSFRKRWLERTWADSERLRKSTALSPISHDRWNSTAPSPISHDQRNSTTLSLISPDRWNSATVLPMSHDWRQSRTDVWDSQNLPITNWKVMFGENLLLSWRHRMIEDVIWRFGDRCCYLRVGSFTGQYVGFDLHSWQTGIWLFVLASCEFEHVLLHNLFHVRSRWLVVVCHPLCVIIFCTYSFIVCLLSSVFRQLKPLARLSLNITGMILCWS